MCLNVFVFFFSALAVVRPYLPVFLSEQGLNTFQIGILRCAEPASSFLVSPVWGYVADKFTVHKLVMVVCAIGSSLCYPLLIFVPPTTYFLQTATEEDRDWTIRSDESVAEELFPFFSLVTFSLTTILVILNSVFVAGFIPLMDSNAVEICKKYPGNTYGGQRWPGSLAVVLFSPLAGMLVDFYANVERYLPPSVYFLHNHFLLAFAMFAFLGFLSLFPTIAMEFIEKRSPKALSIKVIEVVHNFDVIVTFLVILVIGLCRGVLTGFLFIFMEEVGASKFTMGLTLVVSCVCEIPCLMFSRKIIDTFGHESLFGFGLFAYACRLLGYSFIMEPWQFFPFETLHGICYGLMWANCTEYANQIAPEGMAATMQAVVHAIKAGIGKSIIEKQAKT